jgi:hypothetical protein
MPGPKKQETLRENKNWAAFLRTPRNNLFETGPEGLELEG